jgi:dCTP deaminase
MGVYSNLQIAQAIDDGQIVLHPLAVENIRGSSVDLTLGEWYFTCDNHSRGVYNPFDEDDVKAYFGEPKKAGFPVDNFFKGVPKEHPVIWLGPRQRILAHTHEFIGIKPPGTSEMRARSSWGRNGIAVCLCAGWGDPGYINRWTMEIHNTNDQSVPLPVGERVAQLIFHTTGEVQGDYGDGGKYQTSTDIDQIVADWSPEDMLPRSFKDERKLPLPL